MFCSFKAVARTATRQFWDVGIQKQAISRENITLQRKRRRNGFLFVFSRPSTSFPVLSWKSTAINKKNRLRGILLVRVHLSLRNMALEQETQNSVDLLTLSEYVIRRLYKNVNNGTKLSERECLILNVYELILNDGIIGLQITVIIHI